MTRFLALPKALVLGLTLALAPQVQAQTTELRKLETDYSASVWKAVGRLDFGRGGMCSGTLIAPDLVLTAAHCLYKPGTDLLWKPNQIIFRAGFRNGVAAATRRVTAIAAHAKYMPKKPLSAENVTYDVGLIRLAEPVSTFEVAPFYLHEDRVAPGPVSVVSYGRGRSNVQSRQKECQMLERFGDVFLFDCNVTFGSSGAPVFSHLNGRGRIISVVSGMLSVRGEKRAVGMHLPERVTELRRQMRLQVAPPRAKVRRLKVGQQRGSTGAKFVRP